METHVGMRFFNPTKCLRDITQVACFSARFTARSLPKQISLCTSSALKPPLHTTASRCGTPMLTSNACQCSARVDTARRRATASKYSALILEASEYTGCANSSAMNPAQGRSTTSSSSVASSVDLSLFIPNCCSRPGLQQLMMILPRLGNAIREVTAAAEKKVERDGGHSPTDGVRRRGGVVKMVGWPCGG